MLRMIFDERKVDLIARQEFIMVNVTIYSKKDCHLCDIAKEKLLEIQQEFPFSLAEVDGKKIFNYRVKEDELKSIFKPQPQ